MLKNGPGRTLDVPAVIGIGGSLLYFVDTYREKGSPYSAEFRWIGEADPKPVGAGFYYLDHLTLFRTDFGRVDKSRDDFRAM